MARGLRGRLDRIENNAQAAVGDARQLIAFARGLIEELGDGIDVELVKTPGVSLLDFFRGDVETLPFKLRIKIDE